MQVTNLYTDASIYINILLLAIVHVYIGIRSAILSMFKYNQVLYTVQVTNLYMDASDPKIIILRYII